LPHGVSPLLFSLPPRCHRRQPIAVPWNPRSLLFSILFFFQQQKQWLHLASTDVIALACSRNLLLVLFILPQAKSSKGPSVPSFLWDLFKLAPFIQSLTIRDIDTQPATSHSRRLIVESCRSVVLERSLYHSGSGSGRKKKESNKTHHHNVERFQTRKNQNRPSIIHHLTGHTSSSDNSPGQASLLTTNKRSAYSGPAHQYSASIVCHLAVINKSHHRQDTYVVDLLSFITQLTHFCFTSLPSLYFLPSSFLFCTVSDSQTSFPCLNTLR
jgi:hypothetical protein